MRHAPRLHAAALALLALAAATQAASAQAPEVTRTAPFTPRAILLAPPTPGAAPIMVSSPDFGNQNYQDKRFFQTLVGGLNMAPGVSWSAGPAGTQSYVLFMEGEGGARIDPTVHRIVYNIPATATRLPTGIPKEVAIKDPAGAINGREDSSLFQGEVDGEVGYRGPNFTADGGRPHPLFVRGLRARHQARPRSREGQAQGRDRRHAGTRARFRRAGGPLRLR